MNICNKENLIFPGFCQMIPGFVIKSLDNPGIPGWLISIEHVDVLSRLPLP